ncbi:MAG: LicD family protein [Clostridia bacterium]|nr:LicD family protein [Clostridia bacterium]
MLRIVCNVLDENNLTYWLDYGTLLGAVRHKGYIPWDDDIDIAMTREDYDVACKLLPEALKQYGIDVTKPNDERIGISIWKAGLIMDIFRLIMLQQTVFLRLMNCEIELLNSESIISKIKNFPL